MRIWITDGSAAPFTDITRLSATHSVSMGGEVSYKGALDENVPIGTTTLAMADESDCFVPEAEWCVSFPDGITAFLDEPAALNASTHVVLQGMIEGKWLNRLVGDLVWKPASIGNNLLADGPGISTNIGAIEAGGLEGEIAIRYSCRAGERTQTASISDLRGQNISGLARAVLEHCREQHLTVEAVNCGARGANSALVEDVQYITRVFVAAGVARADLAVPAGWQRVMTQAGKIALQDGLVVEPGTPVELVVTAGGKPVGRGVMTIEPD
jgi:hypothetical protein